jgi:hypothetical protein
MRPQGFRRVSYLLADYSSRAKQCRDASSASGSLVESHGTTLWLPALRLIRHVKANGAPRLQSRRSANVCQTAAPNCLAAAGRFNVHVVLACRDAVELINTIIRSLGPVLTSRPFGDNGRVGAG